jgi:hypothetical protein
MFSLDLLGCLGESLFDFVPNFLDSTLELLDNTSIASLFALSQSDGT